MLCVCECAFVLCIFLYICVCARVCRVKMMWDVQVLIDEDMCVLCVVCACVRTYVCACVLYALTILWRLAFEHKIVLIFYSYNLLFRCDNLFPLIFMTLGFFSSVEVPPCNERYHSISQVLAQKKANTSLYAHTHLFLLKKKKIDSAFKNAN